MIDYNKLIGAVSDKLLITLAVAVLGFVAGRLWKSVLQPWIENSWYSGVRLAACYVGEFVFQGQRLNDLIDVTQRGRRITGTMTFPGGRQGIYKFEGSIIGDVVRGTFHGERLNPRSYGSFLMRVAGRELRGRFIETYEAQVIESSYVWKPKDQ
jgi:hypothetical protein